MIRRIMVPVRGDGKGDNVIAHAVAIAWSHNAHVVVTHCRARPQDLLPFGVPVPAYMKRRLEDQAVELADAEEANLKAEFEALAEKHALTITSEPTYNTPSMEWASQSGRQVDVIKYFGRLADLICVAKPDRDRNIGTNTLKAALFNTGRPVMMCPPADSVNVPLGGRITIAWNGSQEASRAVAQTMDFIDAAQSIRILTATPEGTHGPSADELLSYLRAHGSEAELHVFEKDGRIGDRLLEESEGADLMIMGAYGDSHERETLFGGNTQAIVDRAQMPIVLVH